MRMIYDKPIRALIKDMTKDIRLKPGQVITTNQIVQWFSERYPKVKESVLKAHLVMMSTNNKNRLHHPARLEDDLFFRIDSGKLRLYEKGKDPLPIRKDEGVNDLGPKQNGAGSEFALERDLQAYLVKNLYQIEPGLVLFEDELHDGCEYPAGQRRIDILAQDKRGDLVVVELKLSKGDDRALGQILYYINWVKKNLADPNQKVRGVIIGREITESLQVACLWMPELTLMEYELSVKLKTTQTGKNPKQR